MLTSIAKFVLAFGLIMAAAAALAADPKQDALYAASERAVNSGDADAASAFFAIDGVIRGTRFCPADNPCVGREAVRDRFYQPLVRLGLRLSPLDAKSEGDTLTVRLEARNKAEALLAGGADSPKLIATGAVLAIGTEPGQPELTEEEMRAAVEVARTHKSHATAHAHGAEGIKAAIRAGVRSIEHASLIDDEGLAMAKAEGVWLVMDVYNGDYIEEVGTKEGWPAEYLRKNRETTDIQREGFSKAVRMGVRIGFGTDSGVYPHGLNARQFAYMVRYGMTPLAAIRSATVEAARLVMRENDIGSLTPGHFGDLIAVKGDPLRNIRTLEAVEGVIKGGVRVK